MAKYLHVKNNDTGHECRTYKSLQNPVNSGKITIRACIKTSLSTQGEGIGIWKDTTNATTGYASAVGYVVVNYDATAKQLKLSWKDDNGNGNVIVLTNSFDPSTIRAIELTVDYDNSEITVRVIEIDGTVSINHTETNVSLPSQIQVITINSGADAETYTDWVKVFINNQLQINDDFENVSTPGEVGYQTGLCTSSTTDIYSDNSNQCSDPAEAPQTQEEFVSSGIIADQLTQPSSAPHFIITDYPQSVSANVNEDIFINVTVKNDGDASGSFTVKLINEQGSTASEDTGSLDPGNSVTKQLHGLAPSNPGTYTWKVQVINGTTGDVDDSKNITLNVSTTSGGGTVTPPSSYPCGIDVSSIIRLMAMASLIGGKEFDISPIINVILMCKLLEAIQNIGI